MVNTKALGDRLRQCELQQKNLASSLRLSQAAISLKLNNKRPLYLHEAELIARLLDIRDGEFAHYFLLSSCAAQQTKAEAC